MSVYPRTYLVRRRAAIRAVLEDARTAGLIRQDVDPELVLDLIGGAVMYELLVWPGECSTEVRLVSLHKLMHTLGLENGQQSRE